MGNIALGALSAVGGVLTKMALSLVTESFIKKTVILGLDKLVAAHGSDTAKELLTAAEEAWKK